MATKSIDEIRIVPEGLSEGNYMINILVGFDDGYGFRTFLRGPLDVKGLTNRRGFAFGKKYYRKRGGTGLSINILYGENDTDPAKIQNVGHGNDTREYRITTKDAKNLINALNKHTYNQSVSEVTMAPRKAEGPATEEGKKPRDTSFEPLPRDITRVIRSYLGGKTKKTKTHRRKTISRKK